MSPAHQAKLLGSKILIIGTLPYGKKAVSLLRQAGVGEIHFKKEIDAHTAEKAFAPYQLVIDALNNWQDKILASDTCMHMDKTMIHAGCSAYQMQVFTMIPGKSACLRCVLSHLGMDELPRSVIDSNAFEPLISITAALLAGEAIKYLCGVGVVPAESLLQFDAFRRNALAVTDLGPRDDCPDCSR